MSEAMLAIVTRPAGSEENLCRLLADEGFKVARFPMLTLESCVDGEPQAAQVISAVFDAKLGGRAAFENLVNHPHNSGGRAIFVSANAVRFTALLIEQLAVDDAALLTSFFRHVPCVGMGAASEAAIAKQGWNLCRLDVDALTTEELLRFDWAQADKLLGQSVMVCKGQGGRSLLGDELVARGANVGYLESYRRLYPALESDRQLALLNLVEHRAFVILSSGETAINFFSALYDACIANKASSDVFEQLSWEFVVPSLRVKKTVQLEYQKLLENINLLFGLKSAAKNDAKGGSTIDPACLVASNASDAALTKAIKKRIQ